MKRIIKFRGWMPTQKAMVYEISVAGKEITNLDTFFSETSKDGFVWMQFTGLVDKNGKEIYEGDILNFENNGCCVRNGYKEKVTFNGVGYTPFCEANSVGELEYYSQNCEIIGNIYSNPELLN